MGDCHRFPFPQTIQKSALYRKEIGWLSPFFASSDLHHGLHGGHQGATASLLRMRELNRAVAEKSAVAPSVFAFG